MEKKIILASKLASRVERWDKVLLNLDQRGQQGAALTDVAGVSVGADGPSLLQNKDVRARDSKVGPA